MTQCLALATAAFPNSTTQAVPPNPAAVARLVALEARGDPGGCAATYLAELRLYGTRPDHAEVDSAVVAYARRAVARAPDVAETWENLATLLRWKDRLVEAGAILREGLRRTGDATARARLWWLLIQVQRAQGDSAAAGREATALLLAAARSARPALLAVAAQVRHAARGSEPAQLDTFYYDLLRTATAAGDWTGRLLALEELGRNQVEHGNPVSGLRALDAAAVLADSAGRPHARLVARLWRGRAEAKLGRTADAEHDLRAALNADAAAPDVYYLAETWHNLAHVYESAGRWTEAAGAIDRFVTLTRPMRWDALRVISLRDAGTIRWAAGWHAAADADFTKMVQVVDEQHENDYWAGEYFERIGDLARARDYYRAGAARAPATTLPLAGLERVFEALGDDDGAERAAAAHDSLIARWTPAEGPLLPRFLARHGRPREAISLADAWTARQLGSGNLEGAILASLELAELALAGGAPAAALAAAEQADSLARVLHRGIDVVRAEELRGEALLALGDHAAGLARLERAAALAAAYPTSDAVFSTQLALGNGLAGMGRRAGALAAYERAAHSVDQVSALLEADIDRAGYRERHLLPFDHALRLLLGLPATQSIVDEVLQWSGHRKAAALALATASAKGSPLAVRRPVDRAALQARLSDRDALIDYLAIDNTVAAVVVTRRSARLVALPVSRDSIEQLANRLQRPLVAMHGRVVDLARVPFDLAIAHALYDALVAPLALALRGSDRLTIVPDGPLHAVPFEALVSVLPSPATRDRYRAARFLLDDYEVAYAPSTQLFGPESGRLARSQILVVERDVPGGAQEIGQITAALAESRITLLRDQGATETAVRERLPANDIVHFATHAEASSRDPLASRLDLAADSANDGYLHLNEITARPLRARLVVLSGCETLEGRLYQGEGMMGLARAFLVAGAHDVVATRWPVGPATADLMGEFYRRLAAGARPSEALQGAKRTLRAASATAHPFYWAGFTLVTGR